MSFHDWVLVTSGSGIGIGCLVLVRIIRGMLEEWRWEQLRRESRERERRERAQRVHERGPSDRVWSDPAVKGFQRGGS